MSHEKLHLNDPHSRVHPGSEFGLILDIYNMIYRTAAAFILQGGIKGHVYAGVHTRHEQIFPSWTGRCCTFVRSLGMRCRWRWPICNFTEETTSGRQKLLYRPISASVATVAMCEVEYNLQLFWQFQQEMTAKVSAGEPSRKSSRAFLSRYFDIIQSKEARERYLREQMTQATLKKIAQSFVSCRSECERVCAVRLFTSQIFGFSLTVWT